MKQLFLLRHGEAGFSEASDFHRRLTQKGIEDLNRMGKILFDRAFNVDVMFCSSAQRTLETSALIKNWIGVKEEIFTREIYDANLFGLLRILEKAPFLANSCLLVGHNPSISQLLSHLTQECYVGIQPGMMAAVDLDIKQWDMVREGCGVLKEILQ